MLGQYRRWWANIRLTWDSILAEQEVEFYAECYLLNSIGDEDSPNFLK